MMTRSFAVGTARTPHLAQSGGTSKVKFPIAGVSGSRFHIWLTPTSQLLESLSAEEEVRWKHDPRPKEEQHERVRGILEMPESETTL